MAREGQRQNVVLLHVRVLYDMTYLRVDYPPVIPLTQRLINLIEIMRTDNQVAWFHMKKQLKRAWFVLMGKKTRTLCAIYCSI